MKKILFARNILGNDAELFGFAKERFSILSAAITGTQVSQAAKITKWSHENNLKFYARIQFIYSTPMDTIKEKLYALMISGVDGFIFHGQTSEDKINETLQTVLEISEEFSGMTTHPSPVVFMVDHMVGGTNLAERLYAYVNQDVFPKIDVRVAARIPSKNITQEFKFPLVDLSVIDFGPFDNQDTYETVDRAVMNNELGIIAYMTYDNMSDGLKEAIRVGYKLHSSENQDGVVEAMHDLTLRDNPSGQVIKNASNEPVVVKSGVKCLVLGTENRGSDTWFHIKTQEGVHGYIAGKIGSIEYSK